MGHQFTIDSDEAFALATELAALTGESLEAAVTEALRSRIASAQTQRAAADQAYNAVIAFHDLLENPRPDSDLNWMYDDTTGLPIW